MSAHLINAIEVLTVGLIIAASVELCILAYLKWQEQSPKPLPVFEAFHGGLVEFSTHSVRLVRFTNGQGGRTLVATYARVS